MSVPAPVPPDPTPLDRLLDLYLDAQEPLSPQEREDLTRFRSALSRPLLPPLPPLPAHVGPRDQGTGLTVSTESGRARHWWPGTLTWAAVAALLVMGLATSLVLVDRDRARERAAAEAARAETDALRAQPRPGGGPSDGSAPGKDSPPFPLRLTVDKANQPVGWPDILVFYVEGDPPEENLRRLEDVSPAVRAEAARLRQEKSGVTAQEILDALFLAWGGPNKR